MKWLALIGVALVAMGCQNNLLAPPFTPDPEDTIPTRAPAPTPNVIAEKDYLGKIQPILTRQADLLDGIETLLANSEMTSAIWKINVSLRLTTMRQNYQQIRVIDSPRSMEAARAKIVEGFDRYDHGANLIQQGIDQDFIAYVDQGQLEWQAGNRSIVEANNLINRMTPSPR